MSKWFMILWVGLASPIFAQQIKFKITNAEDEEVYLIRHFGNKKYMADTAKIVKDYVVFDGKKHKDGMMSLYFAGKKTLDFIKSSGEKEIEIHVDYLTMSPETAVVKKSEENKLFYAYLQELMKGNKERSQIQANGNDEAKLKDLNERMKTYITKFAQDHNKLLVGKFVKMGVEIEVPEPPRNADGSLVDSNFIFKYYREHFFDNIDLKDDRLVNFSIFEQRLDLYFGDQMMIPIPDTILHYSIELIERFDKKSDMFQFVLTYLVQKYDKSKIMGHDKVWIMLAVKYFCPNLGKPNNLIYWLTPDKLETFCEKANKLQHLVVGVRPHNIILPDSTNQRWHSLYDVRAEYTILYFWDPECGHCKKETPKMGRLYNEKLKARNVEVYAVGKATGDDFEKWKAFIVKHNLSFINVAITKWLYEEAVKDPYQFVARNANEKGITNVQSLQYQEYFDVIANPKVFILDKDKKIIGKNLSVAQIEEFLDRLQGVPNAEKLFPVEKDEPQDH
jgi:thiol-disulfide isomerase/thioredoxin